MSQLSICLFGPPTIALDGRPVMLDRWKAIALLAYLAVEERSHRRDGLATLFWPELNQAQARNGLRRTLNALKHALGDQWLDVSRETVGLRRTPDLMVDVWRFRALTKAQGSAAVPSAAALQEAVALYQADFLAEFTLRDAPAFEDWRYFAAEQLRQELAAAIGVLLSAQTAEGNLPQALQTARRWLVLDPLDENAHRTLIELHLAAGDRAAAVRQYAHCVELLAQELGVQPDATTGELLENAPHPFQAAKKADRRIPPPEAGSVTGSVAGSSAAREVVRQIVVLNAAVVAQPAGARARNRQDPLDVFLASAAEILPRYAAHAERLGPEGIVACFGVPTSHEDDAERGLHAAFALRAAAQSAGLELAAGIKIGPALVAWREQGGALQTQEVFGAVVGQAAELQRASAPGQILVDRTTYLHTRSSGRFCEVPLSQRGRGSCATTAYSAVAALPLRKTRGIPQLQAVLVGRTAELALLEQTLAGLEHGTGRVLLLSGEAGIGKSRLVAEAHAAFPPRVLWLEGRCLEMIEAASYGPFLGALREYFGWQLDAGEQAQAASLQDGLAHLASACAWDDATCGEIGAVLGRLLAVRFGRDWDDLLANAAPAELRYRTTAALCTLFCAIAHTQPLALVLEDLHWADDASLDLINDLLPSASTAPYLLLCVYRPLPEHRCSQLPVVAARKCPAHYQELRLHELAPAETAAMVKSLLEMEALAPATSDWIQECSQGNPYFTEETILALIEAGLIRREDSVWRTSDPRAGAPVDLALSFSVDQLIMTRVDRLPAPLHRTLEAAAVLGRTFALPLLHALLADGSSLPAQTGAQTQAQVDELARSSFFYCERVAPVAEYSFRHVLLQAAVYQMLPDTPRSNLHLQAAQAIEQMFAETLEAHVDALAYHYARTQELRRAVDYLLQAGAAARRVFANSAAIAYFQQAIDRLTELNGQGRAVSPQIWIDVWHQLGRACFAAGSYDRAEAAMREAIAHAQAAGAPAPAIVRLAYWLGEALYWESKLDEFAANARTGLALLSGVPCCETALMLGHLAAASMAMNEPQQYERCVRELRPLVRTLPFSEELSPAYHQVIDYYKLAGDAPAALEWVDALRAAAAAQGDRMSLAKAVMIRGVMLSEQGNFGGAAPVLAEALALSRQMGESTLLFFCLRRLALNAVVQGDPQTACRYADQLLELVENEPALAGEVRITCGVLCLGAGETEKALGLLAPGAGDGAEDSLYDTVEARYWRGCALAAAGRTAEAVAEYAAVLQNCRPDYGPLPVYLEMKPVYWAALAALARLLPAPTALHALCDAQRARWPASSPGARRVWHEVAAEPVGGDVAGAGHEVTDQLLARWQWCDPYGDSTRRCGQGVELAAVDGRDLWYINLGAPALRIEVAGDFVLQVRCRPATLRPLTMGGLLLWCDGANFLRLDWGGLGPGEISCLGASGGARQYWGRARTDCPQPYLRLERCGQQVRALYSEDSRRWLLAGETALAGAGPWAAGLFGLGMVDRTVYPGAPAGGAAIRFAEIRLWQG